MECLYYRSIGTVLMLTLLSGITCLIHAESYAAPVVLISTVRYRALARTRVLSTGVYSLAPQAYLTRALAIKMTIRNSPTLLKLCYSYYLDLVLVFPNLPYLSG